MQENKTEYLVKKARRHDPDAFSQLIQLYKKDMYRVALAILVNDEDASDAIQDTILACWEKIHGLRQVEYFKTWMTRILINKCYDIRRNRELTTSLVEYEEPAREDNYNLELKEALSALNEKYRIILTLFYSEGYHIDEIAKILKLSPNTVKTRLRRGKEKLAKDYYYNENERGK